MPKEKTIISRNCQLVLSSGGDHSGDTRSGQDGDQNFRLAWHVSSAHGLSMKYSNYNHLKHPQVAKQSTILYSNMIRSENKNLSTNI